MLEVPREAVPWIRKQRTHLDAGDDYDVAGAYAAEIGRELDQIWMHLPSPLTRWVEIGCGMAGLSALLYRRLRRKPEQFWLLDGTGEGAIQAGWHDRPLEPWNDRDMARAALAANRVPLLRGLWLDIGTQAWDGGQVDLIVSTLSWGHHYPVAAYGELVSTMLAPGGVVILDLRIGRGGEAELQRLGLEQEAVLPHPGLNGRKCTRQVWQAA